MRSSHTSHKWRGVQGALRNPFLQPFASNSTWNIGIGSGATWETTSATATAHLITMNGVVNSNINGNGFNQPIYLGQSTDLLLTVTALATDAPLSSQSIRVPIGAVPAPGTFNTGVTFTGSQSGTTLTVSAIAGGLLHAGQSATTGNGYRITGTGITGNFMTLTTQLTGTAGSNGTYTVNRSQTLTSRAMTAVSGDQHMAFVDANQPTKLFSYYGCFPNNADVNGAVTASTTTIVAIAGTVLDIAADGVYPFGTTSHPLYNGTGTGGHGQAYTAGEIRDWEITAGVINHALRCSIGTNDAAATGADYHTNILWPDSNCDFNGPLGAYTGVIPYGSTLGIPAATVLTGRGLSVPGLMVATCIQKYGVYIRDTGGSNQITLYTDTVSAGNSAAVTSMQNDFNTIIKPLMRKMTNQTTDLGATNLNGGGTYPPLLPAVDTTLIGTGGESPDPTFVTTVGPTITDSFLEVFSITAGAQVAVGQPPVADGTTANVTKLAYTGHKIYQANNAAGWWFKTRVSDAWTEFGVATVSVSGTTYTSGAPAGTVIGTMSATMKDASTFGGTFSLSDNVNFQVIGSQLQAKITLGAGPFALTITATPITVGGQTVGELGTLATSITQTATGTGTFRVSSGQILQPDGTAFYGKGINCITPSGPGVALSAMASSTACLPLLTVFPKVKFIRLACWGAGLLNFSADSLANIKNFVDWVSAKNIVVEIECHPFGNPIYTGTNLTNITNWYTGIATNYVNNPYVWFGGINEPGNGCTPEDIAIYNAVRNAGCTSPFMMSAGTGSGNPPAPVGATAASYRTLTNIVWDLHYYGWMSGWTTGQQHVNNQTTSDTSLATNVTDLRNFTTSADGTIPIIIGEFGNSTTGTTIDAEGLKVTTSVINSHTANGTVGYAAWNWYWNNAPDGDNLTNGSGALDTLGASAPYAALIANDINA